MPDRFFLTEPPRDGHATLTGPDAHHLGQVLRAKPGLEVVLFDGAGGEYRARVLHVGRQRIDFETVAHQAIERETQRPLTLAVALPKGERQRWLIEKLTELGVARLVPLVAERGVAQPTDGALERLRRGVIEASKQCGRNRLLEIAVPHSVAELIPGQSSHRGSAAVLSPQGSSSLNELTERLVEQPSALLAVGPEGGWTPRELEQFQAADWSLVSLGARTLRVETAAIAAAAWFAALD